MTVIDVDTPLDTIEIEEYSVIYSFDCATSDYVHRWQPPKHQLRKLWVLTERDDHDGDMKYCGLGKHRKYGALLTPDQFKEFVDHTYLRASTTPTMGSIGAPGFGFGWAPAIMFESDDHEAYVNAYVTPIPAGDPPWDDDDQLSLIPLTDEDKAAWSARLWDRVIEQVIEEFG